MDIVEKVLVVILAIVSALLAKQPVVHMSRRLAKSLSPPSEASQSSTDK